MKYPHTATGIFIRRPNRFIAHVEIDGRETVVHVKNTGRCAELLLPGARVILEKAAAGVLRKTAYSLIAVYKGELLINLDSQAPNRVVYESAASGKLDMLLDSPIRHLRGEVTFGKSRFDLYWETERGTKAYMEVKGVTLEDNGVVRFPDAPTKRGAKHVLEMIEAAGAGYEGYLMFLIQMKGVSRFEPNESMDPAFAQALRLAAGAGVRILAYDTAVEPDAMILGQPVRVCL
ncbi:MAG: sugar fermentation stimulation protein [Paenibacillaceae bacterium]|jgi:sugar fermentation stimulation protein A|nr:sugar fermentation stimulation protein [Paenibacillaceae bacterium]